MTSPKDPKQCSTCGHEQRQHIGNICHDNPLCDCAKFTPPISSSRLGDEGERLMHLEAEVKELRHLWDQNETWLVQLKVAYEAHTHDVDRDGIGMTETSIPQALPSAKTSTSNELHAAKVLHEKVGLKGGSYPNPDSEGELERQALDTLTTFIRMPTSTDQKYQEALAWGVGEIKALIHRREAEYAIKVLEDLRRQGLTVDVDPAWRAKLLDDAIEQHRTKQ